MDGSAEIRNAVACAALIDVVVHIVGKAVVIPVMDLSCEVAVEIRESLIFITRRQSIKQTSSSSSLSDSTIIRRFLIELCCDAHEWFVLGSENTSDDVSVLRATDEIWSCPFSWEADRWTANGRACKTICEADELNDINMYTFLLFSGSSGANDVL